MSTTGGVGSSSNGADSSYVPSLTSVPSSPVVSFFPSVIKQETDEKSQSELPLDPSRITVITGKGVHKEGIEQAAEEEEEKKVIVDKDKDKDRAVSDSSKVQSEAVLNEKMSVSQEESVKKAQGVGLKNLTHTEKMNAIKAKLEEAQKLKDQAKALEKKANALEKEANKEFKDEKLHRIESKKDMAELEDKLHKVERDLSVYSLFGHLFLPIVPLMGGTKVLLGIAQTVGAIVAFPFYCLGKAIANRDPSFYLKFYLEHVGTHITRGAGNVLVGIIEAAFPLSILLPAVRYAMARRDTNKGEWLDRGVWVETNYAIAGDTKMRFQLYPLASEGRCVIDGNNTQLKQAATKKYEATLSKINKGRHEPLSLPKRIELAQLVVQEVIETMSLKQLEDNLQQKKNNLKDAQANLIKLNGDKHLLKIAIQPLEIELQMIEDNEESSKEPENKNLLGGKLGGLNGRKKELEMSIEGLGTSINELKSSIEPQRKFIEEQRNKTESHMKALDDFVAKQERGKAINAKYEEMLKEIFGEQYREPEFMLPKQYRDGLRALVKSAVSDALLLKQTTDSIKETSGLLKEMAEITESLEKTNGSLEETNEALIQTNKQLEELEKHFSDYNSKTAEQKAQFLNPLQNLKQMVVNENTLLIKQSNLQAEKDDLQNKMPDLETKKVDLEDKKKNLETEKETQVRNAESSEKALKEYIKSLTTDIKYGKILQEICGKNKPETVLNLETCTELKRLVEQEVHAIYSVNEKLDLAPLQQADQKAFNQEISVLKSNRVQSAEQLNEYVNQLKQQVSKMATEP